MRRFALFSILALFYAFQCLVINAVQPNIIVIISDDQDGTLLDTCNLAFLEEERLRDFHGLLALLQI